MTAGAQAIGFSDRTAATGADAALVGMMGHAVAWGDVNGDGWEDLFVGTFADRSPEQYQHRGATGPSPDRLLLGGQSGMTVDTSFPEMFGRTSGAVFADLDSDGDLDLVIGRNYRNKPRGEAPSVVLENRDGQLVAPTTLATDLGARSIGVLDYDGDGRLDLFVTEDRWSGGTSILFHNDGGLRFSDATAAAGLPADVHGLGVTAADLTGDGQPDLVVSGSRPPRGRADIRVARVFVNAGGGRFRETDGSAFTWPSYGNEDDAAGIASGDLNRDGRPDLVIGQHYGSTLSGGTTMPVAIYLHRGVDGTGAPTFEDVTSLAGSPGLPTKSPHVEIADFDNDGWPDILTTASAAAGTRPLVLRSRGTVEGVPRFDGTPGVGSAQYWPTAATADFDHDGRLDVLAVEWYPTLASPLLRNETAGGRWLDVGLDSTNDGAGGIVEVFCPGAIGDATALVGRGEMIASTGYGAGVPMRWHAGLGELERVDVRVTLPHGGGTVHRTDVPADQRISISFDDTTPPPAPPLYLTAPVGGFVKPVHISHAGDGSGRLFVVEQPGRIRIVRDGVLGPASFLDIASRVGCGGGLLSVAFSPAFDNNGTFYVQYDDASCDVVVARFRVSGDPDVADASSLQEVLRIPALRPGNNGHTGGQVAFGPDGYLYLALGDGSSEGDADQSAQNPGVLWGKMLRLDVETGNPTTYTVPASNPFVGEPSYRAEIWALGFRNPWRFSFDGVTGDLFIGDVGEAQSEEIDHQPRQSAGGENYGWSTMEGTSCFQAGCDQVGLTPPVLEYGHDEGCSISGGPTYRGGQIPDLDGWFLYGDYCTGRIWGASQGGGWRNLLLQDTGLMVVSFGLDQAGEPWVADDAGGSIYRLTDRVPEPVDLSVSQVDSPDPVTMGGVVTYQINVTNNGGAPALDVTLEDRLPAGVTLVSAIPAQGRCSKTTTTAACSLGPLAAGLSTGITVKVKAPTLGSLTNTVVVSGNEPDTQTANNTSIATTTVEGVLPSVYVTDARVVEGNSGSAAAAFTVSLSSARGPGQSATVRYATANGTAAATRDYQAVGLTTLTFGPGETTKLVTVAVNGDTAAEGEETFLLKMSSPVGAVLGDAEATARIVDDEGQPVVYVSDAAVLEGHGGTTDLGFTVTLSHPVPAGSTASVGYATANKTAVAPGDYNALPLTTLSFGPGEKTKTVTVKVNGDTGAEATETLLLKLSVPKGAVLADSQATGSILNDDGAAGIPLPSVYVTDARVVEGNSGSAAAAFTVSLSAAPGPGQSATVRYATANGTAAATEDYQAVGLTTLTFGPGETTKLVTVAVNGDIAAEGEETFLLKMSSPVGAVLGGAEATARIVDDEGQPVVYVSDAAALEGQGGTTVLGFTVRLSHPVPEGAAASVAYTTANKTAVADGDYTALPLTTLSFGPGEHTRTVTVAVNGDTGAEATETLLLKLSVPKGAIVGDSQATGSILNDDGAT